MPLFLSTHTNKIDKKGRVSVPAQFRSALADQSFQGLVLFRSNSYECLEGFAWSYMQELSERLDDFDFFSSEQDNLATAIFSEAIQLPLDGDGRIILPDHLISFACLDVQVSFVGLGLKFQIWSPEKFFQRREEARSIVKSEGLTIPQVKKSLGAER